MNTICYSFLVSCSTSYLSLLLTVDSDNKCDDSSVFPSTKIVCCVTKSVAMVVDDGGGPFHFFCCFSLLDASRLSCFSCFLLLLAASASASSFRGCYCCWWWCCWSGWRWRWCPCWCSSMLDGWCCRCSCAVAVHFFHVLFVYIHRELTTTIIKRCFSTRLRVRWGKHTGARTRPG